MSNSPVIHGAEELSMAVNSRWLKPGFLGRSRKGGRLSSSVMILLHYTIHQCQFGNLPIPALNTRWT